jgi:hypothetical protein
MQLYRQAPMVPNFGHYALVGSHEITASNFELSSTAPALPFGRAHSRAVDGRTAALS